MSRSRSSVIRAIAAAVFALCMAGSSALASGVRLPSVVVYVRISGGWHISRLMKSPVGSLYSLCNITSYVKASGKQAGLPLDAVYTVQFEKRPEKTYHRQFGLTVLHYRPGRLAYSRAAGTLIDISVHFHTYFGAPSTDPAYHIVVHMAANARSGTFLAQHVGTTNLIASRPHVTMQGWWTCASLQRRSIPVM